MEETKKQGWLAGLALNVYTPVGSIDEPSWQMMDILQLIGMNSVGFQNQEFNPLVLNKIKEIKIKADQLKNNQYLSVTEQELEIFVDGGIKLDNAHQILSAGATGLAVGSLLWQASNISDTIQQLSQL